MLMMMETGLMEHWRMKHLSRNDPCSGSFSYGTVLRKLTFDDVKSAFLIWFVGLSIAFAVFVAENAAYFVGRQFRNSQTNKVTNQG
jgi:hypothetical protein